MKPDYSIFILIVFSPNPVVDDLYLQSLPQQSENKVEIFNMQGNKVLQFNNCNPCSVSTLASGVYVLSVTHNRVKKQTLFMKK